MSIAFSGQHVAGAGPGAWATGLTALLNVMIIVLSFTKGERDITRFDWACFIAALLAIPLWMVTHNPLYSVVLVTFVDIAGFGPTVRKSFVKPYEENTSPYLIGIPKHILSITALMAYNATTLCLPVALTLANVGLVTIILWRRKMSRKVPAFDVAAGRG